MKSIATISNNKVVDNQLLPTKHQIEPATLRHLTWSSSAFDQVGDSHKETIYLYIYNQDNLIVIVVEQEFWWWRRRRWWWWGRWLCCGLGVVVVVL